MFTMIVVDADTRQPIDELGSLDVPSRVLIARTPGVLDFLDRTHDWWDTHSINTPVIVWTDEPLVSVRALCLCCEQTYELMDLIGSSIEHGMMCGNCDSREHPDCRRCNDPDRH